MRVAGKVWGTTAEVFSNATFELHRLVIREGHRCSKHRHRAKHNGFFVESGRIAVTVWQPEGLADVTELETGQSLVVAPGLFHQFRGLASTSIVYEAYWAGLQPDDIERADSGE